MLTTPPNAQDALFSTRGMSRRERKALQAPERTDRKHRQRRGKKIDEEGEVGKRGPKGWRLPGGGRTMRVVPTPEFRGPTVQVCGLFPFVVGSSLPLIGTPLGEHLEGRGWVCSDPISMFLYGLLNNPSGFVIARRGTGKALDVDTVVPTPSGHVRMGDLRPGDHVIGSDGRPTAVVAVSEVMEDRECYELEFSTGDRIVADAQHLWVTETKADRKRTSDRRIERVRRPVGSAADLSAVAAARREFAGQEPVRVRAVTRALGWAGTGREANVYLRARRLPQAGPGLYDPQVLLDELDARLRELLHDQRTDPEPVIRTTEEIANTISYRNESNHSIAVTGIEGENADLPVGPYTLGAWLGDGTSAAAQITGLDDQVFDLIRAEGYEVRATSTYLRHRITTPGARMGRYANGLQAQLRALGVLNDKHIPASYLRASTAQRRRLLAGLLDTDGTVNAHGMAQFTSTNQRLAQGVHELVASLGYRPTLRLGRARLNGVDCGPKWEVNFTPHDNVFGLSRKSDALAARRRPGSTERLRTGKRYIVSARRIQSRPVRCIQVANRDGIFLVGRSFIATHNSTLMRRMAGFLPYKGVLPMVLSDWKPDYVDLIRQMEGQVLSLNRADRFINPLDPGPVAALLPQLADDERARVQANIRGRRINVAVGLCALALGRDLEAHERNMLSAALSAWDGDNPGRVPVFADIQKLIQQRHPKVRVQAQDRGADERYDDRAEGLLDALNSLMGGDEIFGDVFANHTTEALEIDKPVVFDLSAFEEMDPILQAGVQLVCWTYGSTALAGAKVLAEAGLAPRRVYLLIMDELWRALRAAEFMVDRVDEITRLNRTIGLGQLLCTHGMDDLKLHNEQATAKAWGFVAASEVVYLGGLNPGEMGNLEEVFALSNTEKDQLTQWAQIGEADPETGEGGAPLGRGKFMIKAGKRPGIPFKVSLTKVEIEGGVHNTNKTWDDQIAAAHRSGVELLDEYA